jgi:hypothetical protein
VKDAENFNLLQSWPDAIRDDVAGARYHKIAGVVDAAGIALCRVIRESAYRISNALNHELCGDWIILGNVFGFGIKVLQRLS